MLEFFKNFKAMFGSQKILRKEKKWFSYVWFYLLENIKNKIKYN